MYEEWREYSIGEKGEPRRTSENLSSLELFFPQGNYCEIKGKKWKSYVDEVYTEDIYATMSRTPYCGLKMWLSDDNQR